MEEPDEAIEVELADGLVMSADALVPLEKNMLEYRVIIHLVNSENTVQGSGPSSGDDDDDDSGFDHPQSRSRRSRRRAQYPPQVLLLSRRGGRLTSARKEDG